jgi:hypothetical protein
MGGFSDAINCFLLITPSLTFSLIRSGESDQQGPLTQHRTTDLMPKVSGPHPDGPKYGLGNGQQTILLAVVSEIPEEEYQDKIYRVSFSLLLLAFFYSSLLNSDYYTNTC